MVHSYSTAFPFIRLATGPGSGFKSPSARDLKQKDPEQQEIIIDLTRSTGAALAFRRHVELLGVTPEAREIQGIIDWLKASHIDPILYTTQLGRYHTPAIQFADKVTGLLAVCIDHARAEYLLFFKPPMHHSIRMVDRSETAVMNDPAAKRTEATDLISRPWTQREIATAMRLRKQLQEVQRDKVHRLLVRSDRDEQRG